MARLISKKRQVYALCVERKTMTTLICQDEQYTSYKMNYIRIGTSYSKDVLFELANIISHLSMFTALHSDIKPLQYFLCGYLTRNRTGIPSGLTEQLMQQMMDTER